MPRKPSKTQTKAAQPAPAQLKAVERLLGTRDYPQAIARARALVQLFPDSGAANALLIETLDEGEGRAAATLAAYQWAERRPNSARALETLAQFAFDGHHLLLAYRASDRLHALGALPAGSQVNAAALDALLQQPDGSPATREQVEQFDIGKLHMDASDFAGAVRAFADVAITPARNNRALARFHLGQIDAALTGFLDAWEHDPGNLYALGWALRLRLLLGDASGARALGVPLAQAPARRIEDAYGQISGLLLIHEDQAAWAAFERSRQATWAAREAGALAAEWLQLGAGAASRLGLGDQARALWEQALAQNPRLPAAAENLAALERDGEPPAYPALFEWHQLLPMSWIQQAQEADAGHRGLRLDALAAILPDAALEVIYLFGSNALRAIVAPLLTGRLQGEALAHAGDPTERRAAVILRDLARLPVGTAAERVGFLNDLRECGLVAANETLDYWDGKQLRQIQLLATQIHRELMPTGLPDDLQILLDDSLLLNRDGQYAAAEACLSAILERIPDHPLVLGNLAATRMYQDRDAEAREVLRRVVAVHPDYLFARCNLAGFLIEDGKLEEAMALLDGLAQRPRLHIQEYFTLYGVLAMLNQANGDHASAAARIASLEPMVETDSDRRMLAIAKARVAKVSAGRR